jgi:predicted glycoside hydrolase/deacetylase ChbG (UPF0249 family)
MKLPSYIIANADDLGLNPSVNQAILYGYNQGYINSTSLLTNTDYFTETAQLIHQQPILKNIGLHANFAEGKPLTNFSQHSFLNEQGCWDIKQTNKILALLNTSAKHAFTSEIDAQINKALSANITITHLDSHYHLHTLPCFYGIFLQAAKRYNLKLRLAQTYNQGSFLKFAYRKYINRLFKQSGINYSNHFETVDYYLANGLNRPEITEVMLHPDFDLNGVLTDHYDAATMARWINYLDKIKV